MHFFVLWQLHAVRVMNRVMIGQRTSSGSVVKIEADQKLLFSRPRIVKRLSASTSNGGLEVICTSQCTAEEAISPCVVQEVNRGTIVE